MQLRASRGSGTHGSSLSLWPRCERHQLCPGSRVPNRLEARGAERHPRGRRSPLMEELSASSPPCLHSGASGQAIGLPDSWFWPATGATAGPGVSGCAVAPECGVQCWLGAPAGTGRTALTVGGAASFPSGWPHFLRSQLPTKVPPWQARYGLGQCLRPVATWPLPWLLSSAVAAQQQPRTICGRMSTALCQ